MPRRVCGSPEPSSVRMTPMTAPSVYQPRMSVSRVDAESATRSPPKTTSRGCARRAWLASRSRRAKGRRDRSARFRSRVSSVVNNSSEKSGDPPLAEETVRTWLLCVSSFAGVPVMSSCNPQILSPNGGASGLMLPPRFQRHASAGSSIHRRLGAAAAACCPRASPREEECKAYSTRPDRWRPADSPMETNGLDGRRWHPRGRRAARRHPKSRRGSDQSEGGTTAIHPRLLLRHIRLTSHHASR